MEEKQQEIKKTSLGGYICTTGRRKTSVARVFMKPGSGIITIRGSKQEFTNMKDYFHNDLLISNAISPILKCELDGQYDILCTLRGGGISSQSQALTLGIARAIVECDSSYRDLLKQSGFLTRDPRKVERKKYGRAKARKGFQFSKR